MKLGPTLAGPRGSLVLLEESRDLPIARVQLTFRTGAGADPPGREGMARMAAAVLRRGAAGRSRAAIDEALDRLGADVAASVDAEGVTMVGHVLRRNLEPFLAILAEIVGAPDFPEPEVEKLRRELLAALDEMRDDDRELCGRFFGRHLYGDHPYGRPTGGTAASLAAIAREDLRGFWRGALVPGNLLVGVSGDVGADEVLRLVAPVIAALPEGAAPAPVPLPDAPHRPGRRVLLVDKPDRSQTQILLGQPGVRWGDPHFLPLLVGTTGFGGTFTGRLMTEVRVKRGLSYGAYMSLTRGRGRGHVATWVFPADKDTPDTLGLVIGLIEDLARGGLAEEEVRFARDFLHGHFPLAIDTPERRLGLRVELRACEMDEDYLMQYRDRIAAVTPDQVNAALRHAITPDALAITMVATAGRMRPDLQARAEALALAPIEVVAHDAY